MKNVLIPDYTEGSSPAAQLAGHAALSKPKSRKLSHLIKADRAEGMERLRTLYSILTGVPNKKLRLNSFVDMSGVYGWFAPTAEMVNHQCGSSACALGWAALYPEFQALGLRLNKDEQVHFKKKVNLHAGCAFFALSEDECILFNTFSSTYWDNYGLELVEDLPHRSTGRAV